MKRFSEFILPVLVVGALVFVFGRFLYRPQRTIDTAENGDLKIVTLLPKDAIRSI